MCSYSDFSEVFADLLETTVSVECMVGPNASVAKVEYGGIEVTEDAKRNKGERRNERVGRDLAVGRALMALGNELEQRALNELDCAK